MSNGYCTILSTYLYVPSSWNWMIGMQWFLLHWKIQTFLSCLVSQVPPHLRGDRPPFGVVCTWVFICSCFNGQTKDLQGDRVSIISLYRWFEGAGSWVPSISEALPRAVEEFLLYFAKKLLVWSKENLYSFFVYWVLFSSLYSEPLTASWS